MGLSSKEKKQWHNKGQKYESSGKFRLFHGPTGKPFESSKTTKERQKAYDSGRKNARDNRNR